MKQFALVIGFSLEFVARCFSADAIPHEWETHVEGKHLSSVLASIDKGELRRWPFVYSAELAATFSASDRQAQDILRETCADLMNDLSILSTQKIALVTNAISNTSVLLKWRSLLYQSPSYQNLLMAEAVNHVIIIHLANMALTKNVQYQNATSNLIGVVRESLIPAESWCIALDQERRGKSFGQIVELKPHSSEFLAQKCREIWAEMQRKDNILVPTNANRITLSDLQKHQDMALLLAKYINSDAQMRLVEMIYEYTVRNPAATTRDGVKQIAGVFPMESHAHTKLTPHGAITERLTIRAMPKWCVEEVLSGEPYSALQVAGLLRAIDCGQLESIIYNSLSAKP